MLNSVDYHFNYFNIIRFVLLNKLFNISNVNLIPSLNSIHLFFSIKNVTNYDESQNFNFFYFFKFFLGKLPHINRFSSKLHLGDTFYNYNIELILSKKEIYYFLFFLSNDILSFIDSKYIFVNKNYFYKKYDYLFMNISDVSLFSELKTNIGLFDLKLPLNFKYFFNSNNSKNDLFLMKQFKLKIF